MGEGPIPGTLATNTHPLPQKSESLCEDNTPKRCTDLWDICPVMWTRLPMSFRIWFLTFFIFNNSDQGTKETHLGHETKKIHVACKRSGT